MSRLTTLLESCLAALLVRDKSTVTRLQHLFNNILHRHSRDFGKALYSGDTAYEALPEYSTSDCVRHGSRYLMQQSGPKSCAQMLVRTINWLALANLYSAGYELDSTTCTPDELTEEFA